jgi:hypothetical protein
MALEKNINQVFARVIFLPTNNTYKELLSSGNLSHITNDSIKNQLLELDKMYVSISNMEHHMYREYEEYLYNVTIKNIQIFNSLDIQKTAETGILTPSNPSHDQINKVIPAHNKLLRKTEFRNGLKLSVTNNTGIRAAHKEMTTLLLHLNDLIANDLKKEGNGN